MNRPTDNTPVERRSPNLVVWYCQNGFEHPDPTFIDRLESLMREAIPTVHRNTSVNGLCEIYINLIRKCGNLGPQVFTYPYPATP